MTLHIPCMKIYMAIKPLCCIEICHIIVQKQTKTCSWEHQSSDPSEHGIHYIVTWLELLISFPSSSSQDVTKVSVKVHIPSHKMLHMAL